MGALGPRIFEKPTPRRGNSGGPANSRAVELLERGLAQAEAPKTHLRLCLRAVRGG